MARVREILLPRDSQPQEFVGVDWGNPITQGLVNLWSGTPGGLIDTAGNRIVRHSTEVTPHGYGIAATSDDNSYAVCNDAYSVNTTQVVVVVPTTLGVAGSILTGRYFSVETQHIAINADNTFSLSFYQGTTLSSAATAKAGSRHVVVSAIALNASQKLYVDGVLEAESVDTSGDGLPTTTWLLGAYAALVPWTAGHVIATARFNRLLSATEVAELSRNPWQLFAPRSIPVPVSAGGGTGISGTLTGTLADATSSATATLALAGTLSGSLAAVTSAATGTVAITGAATATLADATLSAAGELQASGSGAVNATLADASLAAAGTLALTGAAAQTLADATLVAIATLPLVGSLSATLGDATLAATGELQATGSGALTQTLADAALNGTGTLAIAGAVAQALAALASSATGTLPITGAVSSTLEALALESAGTAQTVTTGTLSSTLGDATLAAAGTTLLRGSASITLGDCTIVATATMPLAGISGAAEQTLGALTSAATGALAITGSLSATLENCTAVAAGGDPSLVTNSEWWHYEIPAQDLRYSVAPQSLTFTIER